VLEADLDIFIELGVAFAAGLIVGIERQRTGSPFAGARTFPLISLAGALGMLLGPVALGVIGAALAAPIAVAYYTEVTRAEKPDYGTSTEVAAIVTFGLGALCTARELPLDMGARLLAVAAACTATVLILSYRRNVHGFVKELSDADVSSAVKLLALGAIVLPILPDEEVDPWNTINPRALGLLVLLIAGISFAGYAAMRIFGRRRGTGLTAIFGGLASSTAVTLAYSGRVKEDEQHLGEASLAIVLASATMFPRVVVEVFAASPGLGPTIAWPFLAAGLTGFAVGGLYYYRLGKEQPDRRKDGSVELALHNPFSIGSAIKFAAIFAVVSFASKLALVTIGEQGAYIAALLSGVADVDAITLSLSRLHRTGELDATTAVAAIGLAAATNSIVKIGIATMVGGKKLGLAVALGLGAALLVGVPFAFVGGLVQ
jgi:uncharacterized membrane protein (DUF4010 family)